MRTTLVIDDDILALARERAHREHRTVGEVVSQLARQSLQSTPQDTTSMRRNGVPLLPREQGRGMVTMEMVNRFRDELME